LIHNKVLKEVAALAIANFLWAITCVGILLTYYEQASMAALLFISAECIFVAILGSSEWRYRFLLVSSDN
ncbi:membrane protein, partial [marine sediment metagenome]